jgi:hypothetical protein
MEKLYKLYDIGYESKTHRCDVNCEMYGVEQIY